MRVLIRADGDSEIGSGHVMRTLALAEGVVASGGAAWLASTSLSGWLRDRAERFGAPVLAGDAARGTRADAAWTADLAWRHGADWVVLDGYSFGIDFQDAVRRAGVRCLLVDDHGRCGGQVADLLLDHNAGAGAERYRGRAPHTELLLGPDYALLRREIADGPPPTTEVTARARRILITLGATAPRAATELLLRAVAAVDDPALSVAVAGAAADAARSGDPRVVREPSGERIAQLMREADLAVAGAGLTALELCFLGVPTLLVVLADNQVEIARALSRQGAADSLGWHHGLDPGATIAAMQGLILDPERRRTMAERGRALVDGRGVERVLAAMRARGNEPRRRGEAPGARP